MDESADGTAFVGLWRRDDYAENVRTSVERAANPYPGTDHTSQGSRWVPQRYSAVGGLKQESAAIIP